ncbi:hypothetical protein A2U01_0000734, partial [Trifolium medium]|nr:hypothetical protein [Trifolium medium]
LKERSSVQPCSLQRAPSESQRTSVQPLFAAASLPTSRSERWQELPQLQNWQRVIANQQRTIRVAKDCSRSEPFRIQPCSLQRASQRVAANTGRNLLICYPA